MKEETDLTNAQATERPLPTGSLSEELTSWATPTASDRGRTNEPSENGTLEMPPELPGGMAEAAKPSYFSPAQVRAMSRREVRENYDRIFESMRHWQ